MEVITGKITGYDEAGVLTVQAQYDNPERFIGRKYSAVLIGLEDGRTISPEQRRKAYVLMREIADFVGEDPDTEKGILKDMYKAKHWEEFEIKSFSLSDCDMTTAREFISMLVDLALAWDVPVRMPLSELCEDIRQYLYACLNYKKCSVCGKRGELHHMETIGMGNDRTEVFQEGMECMCLCREHHAEYHQIGRKAFLEKYHFDCGVRLDEKLCRVYRVKARRKNDEQKA